MRIFRDYSRKAVRHISGITAYMSIVKPIWMCMCVFKDAVHMYMGRTPRKHYLFMKFLIFLGRKM